jgi:hypothetical protein
LNARRSGLIPLHAQQELKPLKRQGAACDL